LGISFASVARVLRKWNLQPWRVQTFKFSTDPELDAKIRDIVGLCPNPPEKAVVLCIDEKSQVQALDRTAPTPPLRLGIPEARSPRGAARRRPRLAERNPAPRRVRVPWPGSR
jgi:hypothetical protein